MAVENQLQHARNEELVATLVRAGMVPEIADEIRCVISTMAREQVLAVLDDSASVDRR